MCRKYAYLFLTFLLCGLCLLPQIVNAQRKFKSTKPIISVGGLNSTTVDEKFKVILIAGQPFASTVESYDVTQPPKATFGFWSKLLGAPDPPLLDASQGIYNDKIALSWQNDVQSPSPFRANPDNLKVFTVFRNNSEITDIRDPNANKEFADSQVQPGQFYSYDVISQNKFGLSNKGSSIGFANASGTIYGTVKTPSFKSQPGKPISDVHIRVSPFGAESEFVGQSIRLNGSSDFLETSKNNFIETDSAFTIEAWILLDDASSVNPILDRNVGTGKYFELYGNANSLRFLYGDNYLSTPDSLLVDNQWTHVAVSYDRQTIKLYVNGIESASLAAPPTKLAETQIIIGKDKFGDHLGGNLDEIRIWRKARSLQELEKFRTSTVASNLKSLSAYWKFNEGSGNFVFDWTKNRNNLLFEGNIWSPIPAPVYLSALTDIDGKYFLEGIYYDYQNGTQYNVRPFKENHPSFDPQEEQVLFRLQNNQNQINFIDRSEITVSGFVVFEGTNCGVQGAELLYSNIENGIAGDTVSFLPQKVLTDENGEFFATFLPETSSQLFIRYMDHIIKYQPEGLGKTNFFQFEKLNQPIANLKFVDETKYILTVDVVGGAEKFPLGKFEVKYAGKSTGCSFPEDVDWFIDTTDVSGNLVISNLPPLTYDIVVSHIDEPIKYKFESGKKVSLKENNNSALFTWYAPTEIKIDGLENYIKKTKDNTEILVFDQFQSYQFQVSAIENYGNGNISLIDSGNVSIMDEIGSIPESKKYNLVDGKLLYTFKPTSPNFIASNAHPYSKSTQFTVKNFVSGALASKELWAVITGIGGGEESSFKTTSPKLPFLIVHSPPGDQSSASFSKGTSKSTTISHSFSFEGMGALNVHASFAPTASFGGIGVSVEQEEIDQLDFSVNVGGSNAKTDEGTFTISTDETYSAFSSDLIIGGAVNYILGLAKIVEWDIDGDSVKIYENLWMKPDGFATMFVYTEDAIKNNIIPDLLKIGTRKDSADANEWQKILDYNTANKSAAEAYPMDINGSNNISFTAGAAYERTFSSAASETNTFEKSVDWGFVQGRRLGYYLAGYGVDVSQTLEFQYHIGESETKTNETSTTTYFVLQDDDVGSNSLSGRADQFSVDVFNDPIYGTPVFKTVGGESMCPWEPGTVPREGVSLQVSPQAQVDILPSDAAVFQLTLGNTSLTQEAQLYKLSVLHESNPDGALIKINGVPIEDGIVVEVPGELNNNSVNVTMTVERGPVAYDYEGLKIKLASLCDDFSDGPEGTVFYETKSFDVHFIPPCSEIAINAPGNNWTINKRSGNKLELILSGFNLSDPNLEKIVIERATVTPPQNGTNTETGELTAGTERNTVDYKNKEYSKNINLGNSRFLDVTAPYKYVSSVNSDNDKTAEVTWIEAVVLDVDTLVNKPTLKVNWDVSQLQDGLYKIRAKTVCRLQQYGYSQELSGLIDRTPPVLLGSPEPADGVLDPNDQIVVSFSEKIKPLNAYNDSIRFINQENETSIAFSWAVNDNKLFITPEVDNKFIENALTKIEMNGIQDLNGNKTKRKIIFEFSVDRNPLFWEERNIEYTLYKSSSNKIKTRIVNRGSQTYDFEIKNLPQWLTVFPAQNSVVSAGSKEIEFTLDRNLNFGVYSAELIASTLNGDEPLRFEVRVMADPPDWSVSIGQYQYTMNIAAELYIGGEQSVDKFDMVSAFVGQECRGIAGIKELLFDDQTNKYLILLTVYSDKLSGDDVQLRVWDALEGIEYARTIESFQFQNNTVHGTVRSPLALHATDDIFQRRDVKSGWTWVSYNVVRQSTELSGYLSPFMKIAEGDLVKNQTGFIQYSVQDGWVGSLIDVDLTNGYMVYLSHPNLMETYGAPADPFKYPVQINSGWNLIGYLPQLTLPLDEALSSFSGGFSSDDFVKSQTEFAFYVEGSGWLGSLTHMKKSNAYFMKTTNSGALVYPRELGTALAKSHSRPLVEAVSISDSAGWSVNPSDFQYNMTVTAQINIGDSLQKSGNFVLGAFIDGEVRGVATPTLIQGVPYFFLMVYDSLYSGSDVEFKFYDVREKTVTELAAQINFGANEIVGNLSDPMIFNDVVLGLYDDGYIPEEYSLSQNYPNPFNPSSKIEFGLPENSNVTLSVFNILGEEVARLVDGELNAGYHIVTWKGTSENGQKLSSGIYFYKITSTALTSARQFSEVKKMIMLK